MILPIFKSFVIKTFLQRYLYLFIFSTLLILYSGAYCIFKDAERRYETLLSVVIYDQNDIPLQVKANAKGHYVYELKTIPEEFKKLLIRKEDRFYYYHFGINPFSALRALYNSLVESRPGGSSTLTQQLTKNLLGTESDRTIRNKIVEAFYALCLEVFSTKEEILVMYANTVFLGNQVQGFETASMAYFNKSLTEISPSEQLSLLATLSYPASRNPWEEENTTYAEGLHTRLFPTELFVPPQVTTEYAFQNDANFELKTSGITCGSSCETTIDATLTKELRDILVRHIKTERSRGARNGAIVVIDPKTSELLAIIGSPDPQKQTDGNQINMAIEPRPIGSTVKPFIYLKGFTEGLRPYTKVEDREYKYSIATGFPLYPKNFDGQYRGVVTLHEALSNSLNVPSVKVLEYIGLEKFYQFLSKSMKFQPLQPYESYQYGIALGGLEMDLLTLTHYFTLFPREGTLAPLQVLTDSTENFDLPSQSDITKIESIASPEYVELVQRIISDRLSGVNQFGLESNLNLQSTNYAVKTGTSRDFHDSWVVGYTPDYVVGVWIGNSENQALEQVSGLSGAGAVWHDVMEYIQTTTYNKNTPFEYEYTTPFTIGFSDEWGLEADVLTEHMNLFQDDNLILSIHQGDRFEFTQTTTIPLRARSEVSWTINGKPYGEGKEILFTPKEAGTYEITAFDKTANRREILAIEVTLKELP